MIYSQICLIGRFVLSIFGFIVSLGLLLWIIYWLCDLHKMLNKTRKENQENDITEKKYQQDQKVKENEVLRLIEVWSGRRHK